MSLLIILSWVKVGCKQRFFLSTYLGRPLQAAPAEIYLQQPLRLNKILAVPCSKFMLCNLR